MNGEILILFLLAVLGSNPEQSKTRGSLGGQKSSGCFHLGSNRDIIPIFMYLANKWKHLEHFLSLQKDKVQWLVPSRLVGFGPTIWGLLH